MTEAGAPEDRATRRSTRGTGEANDGGRPSDGRENGSTTYFCTIEYLLLPSIYCTTRTAFVPINSTGSNTYQSDRKYKHRSISVSDFKGVLYFGSEYVDKGLRPTTPAH